MFWKQQQACEGGHGRRRAEQHDATSGGRQRPDHESVDPVAGLGFDPKRGLKQNGDVI